MTVDVAAIHAELAELTARRVNEVAGPSRSCPPHAVLLHRVAALMTTENLPPATVTVTVHGEVRVDATGTGLIESNVRRWAAALGLVVTEAPYEADSGFAAIQWYAAGFDGHGTGVGAYWHVHGYELLPTPIVDRFGVGIGALS